MLELNSWSVRSYWLFATNCNLKKKVIGSMWFILSYYNFSRSIFLALLMVRIYDCLNAKMFPGIWVGWILWVQTYRHINFLQKLFFGDTVSWPMVASCQLVANGLIFWSMRYRVYTIKYAHGFVLLCFVVVIIFFYLADPCKSFTVIARGCITGTWAIEWFSHPRYQTLSDRL